MRKCLDCKGAMILKEKMYGWYFHYCEKCDRIFLFKNGFCRYRETDKGKQIRNSIKSQK